MRIGAMSIGDSAIVFSLLEMLLVKGFRYPY